MSDELSEALSIFITFASVLRAMDEEGEFETPLTGHEAVAALSFPGGSIRLHVDDFRRLDQAHTNELIRDNPPPL